MNRKEKILFVLLQLFLLTLLFPVNDKLSGIITGSMMLFCIAWDSPKEKIQLLKERKYIIWMLLFFAWIFISVFLSSDRHQAFLFLDPRLPLAFFPVSIGLVKSDKGFKEKVLLGFAVVITFCCIICLVWASYKYIQTHNADWFYNDALTDLTKQQSIYIALLVNIAVYIFAYFILYKKSSYKPLYFFAILFLFMINYLLASRNMMLVLYLSVFGFTIYYILKQKKYLEGATLVLGVVVGLFMIFKFFPETLNRFKELTYTKYEYSHLGVESHYGMKVTADQWNGANFRMAAWKCGWELFKKNPWIGTDIGDKKDALYEKYREKDFQFALKTGKNLHNNYLDILTSLGIIGLLLFIIGWMILPVIKLYQQKDYLSLLIASTFFVAMFTEIYFDRSLGGMLFGFFIPFLLSDKI